LWIERGIKILPGATIAFIESTEADIGFRFPSDMKDLYRVANVFQDCDMACEGSDSWMLTHLKRFFRGGFVIAILAC